MTARRELREGGARGARQARVSLCVGARGWQHEFGRQWFCAPSCASAALFSAQSFAVGCGGYRCAAEQAVRLLVAIATRLRTIFRCDVTLLIQPLRSGPLPSQMNGPTPRNRPPTRRTACRRRFVRLGTNRPSLASGSQARRRTVGPARMTLQRSPQPSRAKGRVSATLERRMQTTKLGSLTSMVSTQQTRR